MGKLKDQPVTILLCAAFVLAAGAGAVIVIVHPDTLSFSDYLGQLGKLATALGLLGIGKGIHAAAKVASSLPVPASIPPVTVVPTSASVADDEGPGDDDTLPHIEATEFSQAPTDLGERV